MKPFTSLSSIMPVAVIRTNRFLSHVSIPEKCQQKLTTRTFENENEMLPAIQKFLFDKRFTSQKLNVFNVLIKFHSARTNFFGST